MPLKKQFRIKAVPVSFARLLQQKRLHCNAPSSVNTVRCPEDWAWTCERQFTRHPLHWQVDFQPDAHPCNLVDVMQSLSYITELHCNSVMQLSETFLSNLVSHRPEQHNTQHVDSWVTHLW